MTDAREIDSLDVARTISEAVVDDGDFDVVCDFLAVFARIPADARKRLIALLERARGGNT